jgi:hypothetical protein
MDDHEHLDGEANDRVDEGVGFSQEKRRAAAQIQRQISRKLRDVVPRALYVADTIIVGGWLTGYLALLARWRDRLAILSNQHRSVVPGRIPQSCAFGVFQLRSLSLPPESVRSCRRQTVGFQLRPLSALRRAGSVCPNKCVVPETKNFGKASHNSTIASASSLLM